MRGFECQLCDLGIRNSLLYRRIYLNLCHSYLKLKHVSDKVVIVTKPSRTKRNRKKKIFYLLPPTRCFCCLTFFWKVCLGAADLLALAAAFFLSAASFFLAF